MRSSGRRPASGYPGLVTRRHAAAAVADTLGGATLDEALAKGEALSAADLSLARAIATAAFRHLETIRRILAARLRQGLPSDVGLFSLLATGAAQLLFLRVADHAAVDLAVRLADERASTRRAAGMVNAVLRGIARDREALLAVAQPVDELPDWLRSRWEASFGPEAVAAIAAAQIAGPSLDLTCRSDAAGWAERLEATLLPTGSLRLRDRRVPSELPGFAEGAWWVQDAAAALPARLLGDVHDARVLDLCAAPGGKTAQLAASGAAVTAVDRSAQRLGRLRANLQRLGLKAEILCQDGLSVASDPYDAVLLDAPCTATGTIRRHPDIPWRRGEAEVAGLVDLQARLLDRAGDLTRPGGRLVYCVCSLELEEGERQAEAFLARRPDFARVPIDAAELGVSAQSLTSVGDLRTRPDMPLAVPEGVSGTVDGFFAARFVRA